MRNIYYCYPEGKHKALTMSYDDGSAHDRKLVALFNKHGIRGTFNLNFGNSSGPDRISPAEYPELYAGHEIACHTLTHPTLERCPIEHVALQILEDRKGLEKAAGLRGAGTGISERIIQPGNNGLAAVARNPVCANRGEQRSLLHAPGSDGMETDLPPQSQAR